MSIEAKKLQRYLTGMRRDRSKNKRGASHAVNPAGTKIAKAFEKRVWCGRARGPYA